MCEREYCTDTHLNLSVSDLYATSDFGSQLNAEIDEPLKLLFLRILQ
jgi:hypothetical protein